MGEYPKDKEPGGEVAVWDEVYGLGCPVPECSVDGLGQFGGDSEEGAGGGWRGLAVVVAAVVGDAVVVVVAAVDEADASEMKKYWLYIHEIEIHFIHY